MFLGGAGSSLVRGVLRTSNLRGGLFSPFLLRLVKASLFVTLASVDTRYRLPRGGALRYLRPPHRPTVLPRGSPG